MTRTACHRTLSRHQIRASAVRRHPRAPIASRRPGVSARTDASSAQKPASPRTKPTACPYSHRGRSRIQIAGTDSGAARSASATSRLTGATSASHVPNASSRQAAPSQRPAECRPAAPAEVGENPGGDDRPDGVHGADGGEVSVEGRVDRRVESDVVPHLDRQLEHVGRRHRQGERGEQDRDEPPASEEHLAHRPRSRGRPGIPRRHALTARTPRARHGLRRESRAAGTRRPRSATQATPAALPSPAARVVSSVAGAGEAAHGRAAFDSHATAAGGMLTGSGAGPPTGRSRTGPPPAWP